MDNKTIDTLDINGSSDELLIEIGDANMPTSNASDMDSKPVITGAIDDMDDITNPEPTYAERVARAMANNPATPCSRDKLKDEKYGKVFTYASVPFFLISIAFSLFNMGRIRYPFSFLFISLALAVLSTGYLLRYRNNKTCTCSLCETQAKSLLMSGILWVLGSVGCMIAFAVTLSLAL